MTRPDRTSLVVKSAAEPGRSWLIRLAWGLLLTGGGLVVASFVIDESAGAGYSTDDAIGYQRAADRLHELSLREAAAEEFRVDGRRELRDAQVDFVERRERLDAARRRGPWLRAWLRYAGAALTLLGAAGIFTANHRT